MKRTTLLSLAGCLLAAACGGDDKPGTEQPQNPGPAVTGPDFSSAEQDPDELESGDDSTPGSACTASPSDSEANDRCIGTTFESESIPLDLYIMFDQSGSMCSCLDPGAAQICPNPDCEETRLDAVRSATERFLLDPQSAGLGVGLGRFGNQPIGQASCDVATHRSPVVDVGTLPEHAPSIVQALNGFEPIGETPTGAAIRGACSHAREWRAAHPTRRMAMLLLTDGRPEAPLSCEAGTCCPSLGDAVAAAEECRTDSEIDTYVLGVGPFLEQLDDIAQAGGTERAHLVDGGDVSARVLQALNRIRVEAAIPCELQLPPAPNGQTLDYERVNLEYESSSCAGTLLYAVRSASECSDVDGWYYDDPTSPTSIRLCPKSCERVSAPGGSLSYSVGCDTQFSIR
jgi:hypothetical protein